MATITITVPNDQINRAVDALCALYKYQDTITDEAGNTIPNPETRAVFARKQVARFVRESVLSYEAEQARKLAEANVVDVSVT